MLNNSPDISDFVGKGAETELHQNIKNKIKITQGDFRLPYPCKHIGKKLGSETCCFVDLHGVKQVLKGVPKIREDKDYLVTIVGYERGDDFGYAVMNVSKELGHGIYNKDGECVAWIELPDKKAKKYSNEYFHIYLKGEALDLLTQISGADEFSKRLDRLENYSTDTSEN